MIFFKFLSLLVFLFLKKSFQKVQNVVDIILKNPNQ